jgi:hypothetical protein
MAQVFRRRVFLSLVDDPAAAEVTAFVDGHL